MVQHFDINYFYLDVKDPRFFTLIDFSEWAQYTNSDVFIEITMPGYDKEKDGIVLCWEKNAINKYDSRQLLCPCASCNCDTPEPLPDGIYHLRLFVQGEDCAFFEKHVVRTTATELELAKRIAAMSLNCDYDNSTLMEVYNDVMGFIVMSKSNAMMDNIKVAGEFLERAQKRLKSLDCGQ